ncbi:MAG: RHS repeat-associated core domain-containing protein, partial [Gemmatimonadota bacterium]|nr:RHS repeat-associated core domain-containing protein [Gemmatimonadota bacterium]
MTRSDTRLQAVSLGGEQKVATHPVAQLNNEDIPVAKLLQGTHRSLLPRTHSFHTSYDSFGNQTTSFSTRYKYTGREYDTFSGFYYYRARWYDGNLGRFVSEDPIGFRGGDVNLYGYVKNRPLRHRDPRGLDDADRDWEDKINPPNRPPNPWHWSHNERA